MTCQQTAELLSSYVDGELVPADRAEIDVHLAECTSCLAQVESARCLKHAVARLAGSEAPPDAVRARIGALRFRNPTPSYRWRLLALTAAVGLLTFAVYAIRRHQSPAPLLGEELVSDYLHSLPEVRPPEVASDDPSEVIRFFSGKTPFAPVVPTVPAAQLVGGRLCSIAGRRVELLFYVHDESRRSVALFVSDHSIGEAGCREYRGYPVCSRRFGALTVLAVGEVPGHILEQILREVTL